ncbi:MAG: protein translocase subunit SecD [Pseudomonadota bacterium]
MIQISKWKLMFLSAICVLGIFFASPNFFDRERVQETFPEWLQPVNLGLDLQGGSQLLLEVDVEAGLKDYLDGSVDGVRTAFRGDKIGYTGLGVRKNAIRFKLRKLEDRDRAFRVLARPMQDFEIAINEQGQGQLVLKPEVIRERKSMMVRQSIEIVRRRIDEYGTAEPNIQQQGEGRILVQLPGVGDPARVRQLLGKTAKMTFRMVHPDSHVLIAKNRVPAGYERLPSEEEGLPDLIIGKRILLSGENLVSASAGFHQENNSPIVNFRFDAYGGRKFADITRKNRGRRFAIVLDNKVLSAPRINNPIPGGQAYIEGGFTVQQTTDLALLMRAGALPAPLIVIEERTVGPGLGADSIAAGKMATVIAVILVAVFMLLVYTFFGVVANIALAFNLILLIAIMSVIGATLTLPGIAGIALTIGMAVDANVLIYERIREEVRNGHKILSAIDAGYTQAMGTIIDSNLTTLIGAALLFIFGTGPIRGFAVTLSIGILVSMFTAISLTRVIVVLWYHWRRPTRIAV